MAIDNANPVKKVLEFTLYRDKLNKENTEGELYMSNTHFCYTLEDTVRSTFGKLWNKVFKIKAKTAIPYGRYRITVTWSSHFKRELPLLWNVPNYEGIRLHNGITELHTEGCPLVSYNRGNGKLISDNKRAMNDLTKIIKDYQSTGSIYITITQR